VAPSIQRGRSWGWWWRLWTTRLRRRPFCRRREASANCALLATPAAQPYYTTNVPDVRFFSTHFVSRQPVIIIAALPFTPKDFPYTRICIYIYVCIYSASGPVFLCIYIMYTRLYFRAWPVPKRVVKVLPHTIIVMYTATVATRSLYNNNCCCSSP